MENKAIKLAICAIASNENLYLRDWVSYHTGIGVQKIILFDNSPSGGDYPEHVIGDYAAQGLVEIIRVRKEGRNPALMQEMCYTAAYNFWHNEFDFMLFIDIDEYLTLKDGLTLYEWLSGFRNADLVKLNWMCYTDGGLLHYDGRPVWERFTNPMQPLNKSDWWSATHPVNSTIKTMVNCNQRWVSFVKVRSPHFCVTNKMLSAVAVNASGEKAHPFSSALWIDYRNAWIRHYRTLTIEEFLYRRFTRGIGDARSVSTKTEDILKIFSVENEMTPEKQKIVDEFFSTGPGQGMLGADGSESADDSKLEQDDEFYKALLQKVEEKYRKFKDKLKDI